jgi:type I restriction enzyme S subunit
VISWSAVTLGDVADVLVGYAYKSSDFTSDPSGTRLLRGVNIGQGFLDWGRTAFWVSEGVAGSRYHLAEGDVVLAMDRPWIEAGLKRARLRADDLPALLVQRVARLRGTPAVRTSFLHHLLATETFSLYLQGIVTGATVPHISQSQIEGFRFWLPPLSGQDSICEVLDSIDALIENNRRRVEVLEEMARAIYREWFVNFRYPGHENAALVDSPLGPIPEGWRIADLGSVAEVNRRSRAPGKDEVIRYLDISALGERSVGPMALVKGEEAPGRARRVVEAGDVVWAMVRPNRRAHALLVNPGPDWIASTGLAVLTASAVSSTWLFETTSTQEFTDFLVSQEGGAAYPAVRPKDFQRAPVVVPPEEVDRLFAERVAPRHRLSWTLRDESRSLACLRDLLLPKLVTGQIDVSSLDLDALVEGAVA